MDNETTTANLVAAIAERDRRIAGLEAALGRVVATANDGGISDTESNARIFVITRDALRADLATMTSDRDILAIQAVGRERVSEAVITGLKADLAASRAQVKAMRALLLDARSAMQGYEVTIGAIAADALLAQQDEVARRISDFLFPRDKFAPPTATCDQYDPCREWRCSEPMRHDGEHIARRGDEVLVRWPGNPVILPALSSPVPPAFGTTNRIACYFCGANPVVGFIHTASGRADYCADHDPAVAQVPTRVEPAPAVVEALREARAMIAASGPTPHPCLSEAEIEAMPAKIDAALADAGSR